MSESIVKTKSFELAIRGINFYKWLVAEKKELIMSKQFLRSITSVGANVWEAIMLKARLILFISYQFLKKECDESMYWLELLMGTNYISKAEFESMHNQCWKF